MRGKRNPAVCVGWARRRPDEQGRARLACTPAHAAAVRRPCRRAGDAWVHLLAKLMVSSEEVAASLISRQPSGGWALLPNACG